MRKEKITLMKKIKNIPVIILACMGIGAFYMVESAVKYPGLTIFFMSVVILYLYFQAIRKNAASGTPPQKEEKTDPTAKTPVSRPVQTEKLSATPSGIVQEPTMESVLAHFKQRYEEASVPQTASVVQHLDNLMQHCAIVSGMVTKSGNDHYLIPHIQPENIPYSATHSRQLMVRNIISKLKEKGYQVKILRTENETPLKIRQAAIPAKHLPENLRSLHLPACIFSLN